MQHPVRPLGWQLPLWSLLSLLTLVSSGVVQAQVATPGATPASTGEGQNSANPTSAKEQVLLEKIRQLKAPRWKTFGNCRYDWSAWRIAEGGVRTTTSICGSPEVTSKVAVHCDTLRISQQGAQGAWGEWRLPLSLQESKEQGGEDLMVAHLCANAKPIPATPASPSTPAATAKPGPKVGPARNQAP